MFFKSLFGQRTVAGRPKASGYMNSSVSASAQDLFAFLVGKHTLLLHAFGVAMAAVGAGELCGEL